MTALGLKLALGWIPVIGGGANWWDSYGSPELILLFDQDRYFNDGVAKSYADLIDNTTAGAKSVWLSDGDIGSIGANLPRPAYDPVALDLLGHVIEPALTRVSLYPKCALSAGWSQNGVTATNLALNAQGVFDGVRVAATNHVANFLQPIAEIIMVAGQTYPLQFLYQGGTSGRAGLRALRAGGGNSYLTGVVGSLASSNTSVGTFVVESEELLSDGVTYYLRGSFIPTSSIGYKIGPTPDSGVSGEDMIALAVFIGVVAEELPYCPVVGSDGSTLTVAADAVSLDNGAGLPYTGYDQSQVTAVIAVTPLDDASRRIISFNDGTANEVIEVVIDASGNVMLNVVDGGVTQCSIDSGVNAVIGTELTIAFRAGVNDFAISVNGNAEVTDVAGTIPTVTQLDIGEQCIMREFIAYAMLSYVLEDYVVGGYVA